MESSPTERQGGIGYEGWLGNGRDYCDFVGINCAGVGVSESNDRFVDRVNGRDKRVIVEINQKGVVVLLFNYAFCFPLNCEEIAIII